ncbi:MAG TPA: serine/threonine-protein kinase, partial [Thermoanaerobaculia bacterium]
MAERPEHTETVGEVLLPIGGGTPALPPGTLVAGRFETVRRLGSGGSSIVYEAEDRTLATRVALKILRADRATPAALKRLHREAKIAREAQDPRLVRVWDIGDSAEGAFISMELVEGESLRDAIARGPLSVAGAVRIGCEVLAALERLHALGIVHRDLKPSNVLLTRDGGVKLVDFGLARHWDSDESRATQGEALVGTVEYLSPEQALGKPLDARTDLYSFGILLFEMLTAEVPFRSESTLGAVLAHVNEHAPDVRTVRPEVPSWLARVVARLLEKRPGDRYATAADVLADLQRARARVKVPRRRWLAAAAVLAAALTVAGAWQMSRPQFASVARTGAGVAALDASGKVLWRYGTSGTYATAVRRNGRTAVVAVVDRAAGERRSSVLLL